MLSLHLFTFQDGKYHPPTSCSNKKLQLLIGNVYSKLRKNLAERYLGRLKFSTCRCGH